MNRLASFVLGSVSILNFTVVSQSLGWGSYGHEQISSAAIKVFPDNSFGKCLKKNTDYVVRLAVTPDYEWKAGGAPISDPVVAAKKKENNSFEHPLHYFEPDAFIKPEHLNETTISELPSAAVYKDVLGSYQDLLTANADYVARVDPSKKLKDPNRASVQEVTAHGTAPWRTAQLHRLAVEALKDGDLKRAFFYLGTMAHYVGDMAQPFHSTMNYDGKYFEPSAAGIHSVYESLILEEAAKKVSAKLNKETRLWSSFQATEPQILEVLRRQAQAGELQAMPSDWLIPEMMKMSGPGLALIKRLMGALTYAMVGKVGTFPGPDFVVSLEHGKAHTHTDAGVSIKAVRKFMLADIDDPALFPARTTVLDTAIERMTAGSNYLTRAWASAFEQAKDSSKLNGALLICPSMQFSEADAIMDYPKPDFL